MSEMNNYLTSNEVCINMKHFISKKFQYGMTLDGSLYMNEYGNDIAAYIINPSHLTLIHHYNSDGFWIFAKQIILLDWLSHSYGNRQALFLCPECKKRVKMLYNRGMSFMCKRCSKSKNASQYIEELMPL